MKHHGLALFLMLAAVGLAWRTAPAADQYAWAPNAGWITWQLGAANGVTFNRDYATGFIYSANIGWICLGDGTPQNGTKYSNASATDYGVNVESVGVRDAYLLRGYAWSANAGWINFDVQAQAGLTYQPRIDTRTGLLHGYAWSANLGWIALNNAPVAVIGTQIRNAARSWALYD